MPADLGHRAPFGQHRLLVFERRQVGAFPEEADRYFVAPQVAPINGPVEVGRLMPRALPGFGFRPQESPFYR